MDAINVELSEKGRKEAELIYRRFCERLRAACDEALGDFEVNCITYLETDAWANYHNELRCAMERKIRDATPEILSSEEVWAKNIRAAIFHDFKEELTNQRIVDLEKELEREKEHYREMIRFR